MRNIFVGAQVGSPASTEISAPGITDVNLLSGVASRFGASNIFTLSSSNFELTSTGFKVTVPSNNITEGAFPISVVLNYDSAPLMNLLITKIGEGSVSSATESTLQSVNNELLSIDAKTPALGATTPSSSSPVTLPTDVTVDTGVFSALNTDLLTGTVSGWYDAANYHSVSIQVIGSAGISAGAVIFEQTNSIAQAPSGSAVSMMETALTTQDSTGSTAQTIAASTTRIFEGPIMSRYFRVRISTAFVGGTVRVIGVFSQLPYSSTRYTVRQGTGTNLNVVAGQATAASLNAQVVGSIAEDSATTANPVVVGGVVRSASTATSFVAGDAMRITQTTGGQTLVKPYGLPETDWQYTATLTTTADSVVRAAGAAGIRNYITDISYQNTNATQTSIFIKDGSNVILNFFASANMAVPAVISFPTPRRGTAATAINVACGNGGASVYINIGGYQAP